MELINLSSYPWQGQPTLPRLQPASRRMGLGPGPTNCVKKGFGVWGPGLWLKVVHFDIAT